MNPSWIQSAISYLLSAVLIVAPLSAYAQGGNDGSAPRLADGSGKAPPPKWPPVKYFDGESGSYSPKHPNGRRQLMDFYKLDPSGEPIFFEGQKVGYTDATGELKYYEQVFKIVRLSGKQTLVERGYLIPKALDGHNIRWVGQNYLKNILTESLQNRIHLLQRTFTNPSTQLVFMGRTSGRALDAFALAGNGDHILFEGRADIKGRARVFRETDNSHYVDRGVVVGNHKVEWLQKNYPRQKLMDDILDPMISEAINVRMTVQKNLRAGKAATMDVLRPWPTDSERPRLNYPEIAKDKSPLPSNRSLVVKQQTSLKGKSLVAVGPRKDLPTSGSGRAEVSSSYREYHPELVQPKPAPNTTGSGQAEITSRYTEQLPEMARKKGETDAQAPTKTAKTAKPTAAKTAEGGNLFTSAWHSLKSLFSSGKPEMPSSAPAPSAPIDGKTATDTLAKPQLEVPAKPQPDRSPLPKERSLVTTDGAVADHSIYSQAPSRNKKVDHYGGADGETRANMENGKTYPYGSGRSEKNSPSKEYMPEYDPAHPANSQGRIAKIPSHHALVPRGGAAEINSPSMSYNPELMPSNLSKLLEWNAQKEAAMKKQTEDLINGNITGQLDELFEEIDGSQAKDVGKSMRRRQNLHDQTVGFLRSMTAFGGALALMSAIKLYTDYPNDPRAWTEFAQSLSDPIGYVSFGVFVAVSAPFYRKMASTRGVKSLGWFTLAIAAGTAASSVANKILYDPDFKKCMGFSSYNQGKGFQRDMAACDRLKQKWTDTQGLALSIAPVIANATLATGLFFGVISAGKFVLTRESIAGLLRRPIEFFESPRFGPLASLLTWVGLGYVFLHSNEIAGSVFHFGRSVQRFLLADMNLSTNRYSINLGAAQTDLLQHWQAMSAASFANIYNWKRVCSDKTNKFSINYNCDAPSQIDFESSLDRFAATQADWRDGLFADTKSAYYSWTQKVADYRLLKEATRQTDTLLVDAIAKERATGKAVLTPEYIKALEKSINDQTKTVSIDLSSLWPKIRPLTVSSLILTSMACGPEVENVSPPSWFQSVKNFIYGANRPSEVADNSKASDLEFYPPRLTTVLPGNKTVCDTSAYESWLPGPFAFIPKMPGGGPGSIEDFQLPPDRFVFNADGKTYKGFLDYIRTHIRDSIIDRNNQNHFNEWWQNEVLTKTDPLDRQLDHQYSEMLRTTFKNALTDHSYRWHDVRADAIQSLSLTSALREVTTTHPDLAPDSLDRLANGIFNSLSDELRLYTAMFLDLYDHTHFDKAAGDSDQAATRKRLLDDLIKINEAESQLEALLPTLESANIAKIKPIADQVNTATEDLVKIVNLYSTQPVQITVWSKALTDHIQNVFNQTASYMKVQTAFSVSQAD